MATLSFVNTLGLSRQQSIWPVFVTSNFLQCQAMGSRKSWSITAASKKSSSMSGPSDPVNEKSNNVVKKAPKTSKRVPKRSSKKSSSETIMENIVPEMVSDHEHEEITIENASGEDSKASRKNRKKVNSSKLNGASIEKKVTRRRTTKKIDDTEYQNFTEETNERLESRSDGKAEENREELQSSQHEEEDISFTYNWPPLVCCFGAVQHGFLPSGRPANRLIDHEIHERKKDMLWAPDKFVRAPGGPSSNVAMALATLGGRVAFMGKLGDDEFGQTMLYHLNLNNVQTRGITVDKSKSTGLSYMKLTSRGGLKATCVKPCAEDCLLSSEINIDVLKEAKMFYFNSSTLLDREMRSTTLEAIEISRKFGGSIFFDLNLPLPLWKSREETKDFIKDAWSYADFIEVTKQELEFLCGIESSVKFDTKDNDKSLFVHHRPEVVMPLWHKNLKVLFVTNGTTKIHYYTENDNGFVHGMEDAPITPFTCDMSASGNAIVAALMRMITIHPHLATDKVYLRNMIKYASNCGITDQWIMGRILGFPPKEAVEQDGVRSITEKEYRTVEPRGSSGFLMTDTLSGGALSGGRCDSCFLFQYLLFSCMVLRDQIKLMFIFSCLSQYYFPSHVGISF